MTDRGTTSENLFDPETAESSTENRGTAENVTNRGTTAENLSDPETAENVSNCAFSKQL